MNRQRQLMPKKMESLCAILMRRSIIGAPITMMEQAGGLFVTQMIVKLILKLPISPTPSHPKTMPML